MNDVDFDYDNIEIKLSRRELLFLERAVDNCKAKGDFDSIVKKGLKIKITVINKHLIKTMLDTK